MKDPHKEFDLWLKVFRKSRPEQEISNAFSALLEVIKKMNDEIELLKANSRLNYMERKIKRVILDLEELLEDTSLNEYKKGTISNAIRELEILLQTV